MREVFLFFAIMGLLLSSPLSSGAKSTDEVIVVDKQGSTIRLIGITTQNIHFTAENALSTIPVTEISKIHLAQDGKTLLLSKITGEKLRGTSSSVLEGISQDGQTSFPLSDIQSVDFCRATQILCLRGHALPYDNHDEAPFGDHVEHITFSPDGRKVATHLHGDVLIWDVGTGKLLSYLTCFTASMAFSPDGKMLAIGSGSDPEVSLWDVETGNFIRSVGTPRDFEYTDARTSGVAFTPDGNRLVMRTEIAEIFVELWDVDTGRFLRASTGRTFALSPDGKLLAQSGYTGYSWITLTYVETGNYVPPLGQNMLMTIDEGAVTALAFSSDGRTLAVVGRRKDVYLWNWQTRELLMKWIPEGEAEVVAFSPDGGTLYVAGPYRVAQLDVETGQVLRTVKVEFIGSYSRHPIVLSPDCRLLAIGEPRGVVRLWAIE